MNRATGLAWLATVLLTLLLQGFAWGQYIGVPGPGAVAPAPDAPESSVLLEGPPETSPSTHSERILSMTLDSVLAIGTPSSEIQEGQSASETSIKDAGNRGFIFLLIEEPEVMNSLRTKFPQE